MCYQRRPQHSENCRICAANAGVVSSHRHPAGSSLRAQPSQAEGIAGYGGALKIVLSGSAEPASVGVRFTPPGSATPLVCGAVVRDKILGPPGVGLEFVLAPGDGERLTQAVEVASRIDSQEGVRVVSR